MGKQATLAAEKEDLRAKRKKAEETFNALAAQLYERQKEYAVYVDETKSELSRLQGEYRLLTELLEGEKK